VPHKQGYSRKTIAHNIRHMIAAGHPKKQAVAAALSTARKVAKAKGVSPSHLRRK
jgi:hypothetical protein